MKEDPPPDARCRDKFLVQSVAVTADREAGNISQIWQNIEQTSKSSIQEKKIRVNWLPADGTTGAGAGAATANGINHDDDPPAYSSPSPAAVTPARSTAGASGPISTPADKPSDAKSRGDAVSDAHNPALESSTLSNAASAISSSIPTSSQDLQRQLDAANAKIKQLQQQATEGLRQRNVIGGGSQEKSSGSGTATSSLQNTPAPGGVPVQIVAGLCLLCFLIAYLFF